MPNVQLKVGDKAPDFSLMGSDGKEHSLKSFAGKNVVLYFYPKDDTPGCTKESCSFRDNHTEIEEEGTVVVGVSADSLESHKKFISKYDLNFLLLSDPTKDMIKSYGALKENGGIQRSTFIINQKGKIHHIFPNVAVDGHADEVMDILEGI